MTPLDSEKIDSTTPSVPKAAVLPAQRPPRTVRSLLIGGAICLVLGFGNASFGSFKLREYEALLSKATAEAATPYPNHPDLPLRLSVNTDKQSLYIGKLKARVSLYSFWTLGGNYMLALSGALFLGAFLFARRGADDIDSEVSATPPQ